MGASFLRVCGLALMSDGGREVDGTQEEEESFERERFCRVVGTDFDRSEEAVAVVVLAAVASNLSFHDAIARVLPVATDAFVSPEWHGVYLVVHLDAVECKPLAFETFDAATFAWTTRPWPWMNFG
jgi:hypothetical protein